MAEVTETGAASAPVDYTVHEYDGRMIMPLASILTAQRQFSFATFGPPRGKDPTAGVLDHLRKELTEVARAPHDLEEWMDVVILAFDGALRAGYTPLQVASAFTAKNHKNTLRRWPDWRSFEPGKAIEHVREPLIIRAKRAVSQVVPRHPKELAASSASATSLEE